MLMMNGHFDAKALSFILLSFSSLRITSSSQVFIQCWEDDRTIYFAIICYGPLFNFLNWKSLVLKTEGVQKR